MSTIDKLFRKSKSRDTVASNPERVSDVQRDGVAELGQLEAKRLVREATAERSWVGRKTEQLIQARGSAAHRLDPNLPRAIALHAEALSHLGPREQLLPFLESHWSGAGGEDRRHLLQAWMEGVLQDQSSDRGIRQLAEWIDHRAPDSGARALGLAILSRNLVEGRSDFHPLRLFSSVVDAAPWDADTILTAATPALSAIERVSTADRAYLWYHVFRVTGQETIGANLATLAAAVGAIDEAVAIREALSARKGGDSEHLACAAEALVAGGQYERAVNTAGAATDLKPSSIYALYLRVHALRLLGRDAEVPPLIDAMHEEYERLRQVPPDSGSMPDKNWLTKNLLWFFGNFRPDEQALFQLSEQARREGVEETDIQRARGALLFRTAHLCEAADVLGAVVERDPADHDIVPLLARTFLALERREEARTALTKALEQSPVSLHRAELDSLLQAVGGQSPELPEHIERTREFLISRDWAFLSLLDGFSSCVELSLGPIFWGDEAFDPPRAKVRIWNKGSAPLSLSRSGLFGGKLYLYGSGSLADGSQIWFSDLTNRDLSEFVVLDAGGQIELTLDLTADLQGQLFFEEAKIRPATGWLVAALIPDPQLGSFDKAIQGLMFEALGGRSEGPPVDLPLDPALRKKVVTSVIVPFFTNPQIDLAQLLEATERDLGSGEPETVYSALTCLPPILRIKNEDAVTASWKERISVRLRDLASHPEPIIRARRALLVASAFPDSRNGVLSDAASDPHWYVRLVTLIATGDDKRTSKTSLVTRLVQDADDLVQRTASSLLGADSADPNSHGSGQNS